MVDLAKMSCIGDDDIRYHHDFNPDFVSTSNAGKKRTLRLGTFRLYSATICVDHRGIFAWHGFGNGFQRAFDRKRVRAAIGRCGIRLQ